MLRFVMIGLILALSVVTAAAEPGAPSTAGTATRIECHGKLRQGMVAIGGETTGTTVSCDDLIWELKLPDEAARKFASQHHKQPVTVVGSLRRVTGTERPVRWVVDVTHLAERDAKVAIDGATMTVRGTLHKGIAITEAESQLMITADGISWPLDASHNAELRAKAESLAAKTVLVSGKVQRIAGHEIPPKMKITVHKIEPMPTTAARP